MAATMLSFLEGRPVVPARLKHHVLVPDGATSDEAAQAVQVLEHFLDQHSEVRSTTLSLLAGDHSAALEMPADLLPLITHVLAQAASGNAVAVTPVAAELTTQQAADLLNVSRPYVVKLLDERRIPFRRVGNRRRILVADVMAFKDVDESERRSIAAELTVTAEHRGQDV